MHCWSISSSKVSFAQYAFYIQWAWHVHRQSTRDGVRAKLDKSFCMKFLSMFALLSYTYIKSLWGYVCITEFSYSGSLPFWDQSRDGWSNPLWSIGGIGNHPWNAAIIRIDSNAQKISMTLFEFYEHANSSCMIIVKSSV